MTRDEFNELGIRDIVRRKNVIAGEYSYYRVSAIWSRPLGEYELEGRMIAITPNEKQGFTWWEHIHIDDEARKLIEWVTAG